MDTVRYNNLKIEAMDMNSDIKAEVEDQSAETEGDSTCDSDNGKWMCESSDEDDGEGFEGWPVWSPASYKSNCHNQRNEGFKGLLQ